MSANTPQFTTFATPIKSQSIEFGKILKRCLFHWPLFLIGVALTVSIAYLYLKVTNPVYPVMASMEFKDDKNQAPGSEKTGLKELDQVSTPIIVENEIEIMKSKKLVTQVVKNLQLWVSYKEKKGMATEDLYKASPVKFEFIKPVGNLGTAGQNLEVTVKDHNSFILKDKEAGDKTYSFSTPINSRFGTWQLNPDQSVDSYIGSTLKLTVKDIDQVVFDYQKLITVTLENKDVPFVTLAIADQVPARGKDILNSVMALYNQTAIANKNKQLQATLTFLNTRLDSIGRNLSSAEKQLASYKSSEGLTDISSQSQSYLQNAQVNDRSLNDVSVQLDVIDGIEKYVNSPSEKVPSTIGISDPGLNTLLDKLSELQLKHDQLLATTPEGNPLFNPINRQIETVKAAIKDKVSSIKSSLASTKNQLKSFNSGIQTSIKKVPVQERQYVGMKRDQEITEKLYTYLLQKREEASLRYASLVSDAQIVDDAHAGPVKWPKPAIVYAAAFLLGLIFPATFIISRENISDKVTNRKQIEEGVNIPLLGELSYQESNSPIVVSQDRGNYAIGEQFRLLRTNLNHVHNKNTGGRVTLVTSSTGGEGKSFISSNMAVTLAYASRKTVIMEMDFRKPKITNNFHTQDIHKGISDYLAGDTLKLSDLIYSSGINGLDVMPCGSIPPNPSELLERYKLDELIAQLREVYDDIIIDTPPIHLVTDALIISRVADVSLYVIRQGYTKKEEFDFINEINTEERFPNINIIFNGIKTDKYGYGYKYDNSYYISSKQQQQKRTLSETLGAFSSRF